MNINFIASSMVLIGAFFILSSTILSRKLRCSLPPEMLKNWSLITMFMDFFVIGYILFVVILLSNAVVPLELLSGVVFLAGALFVYLITNIAKKTITSLKTKESLIRETSEALTSSNESISERSYKLASSLNQIRELMQSVIDKKDTSVRFANPFIEKCYLNKACNNEACPCYGGEAVRCWQVAGTFCNGEVQGDFAQKYGNCLTCEVYTHSTSDEIYRIGEHFNNMMHIVEANHKALATAYSNLKTSQQHVVRQEKMASIGQLSAGVAHEINNPIAFISSNLKTLNKYSAKFAEFIKEQTIIIDALASPEQMEHLSAKRKKLMLDYALEDVAGLIDETIEGSERVKLIVQNLKTFSRSDEAVQKQADINECIQSTLNIVWNEIKYKAEVSSDYGELPLVTCHPQQLNQVFMNLLVNASQAIEKDGIITITTREDNGFVKISISDNGSGIEESKIVKIFDPFYTTKPVGQGTGLGLSISNEIIQQHGGTITVESEPGKGTTFIIAIPVN